ncbi:hypothetical protein [Polyangium aurulentum]|uniref:hypothetical protein n=1 Tax=Polyangium aurulentum TaxID=2567896 RepID=UPI00146B937E|nr:hypothetical protein [Polyangium aurulentum]UQA61643.1 hypothetical protein E8A73_014690 [Polyangium aurulentum]
MRALLFMVAGVFAIGCGGQVSEEESNKAAEGGLSLTRVSDTEVVGTFTTLDGEVSFSSVLVSEDVVDVKLDRGDRVLSSHVDWSKFENDLSITGTGAAVVTAEDRRILQALTVAVEEEIGESTRVSDNLVRQSNLWGSHPEGPLAIRHITADEARGWTTLCNGTSYRNFAHDGGGHALQSEYLKYGPAETTNPCRARCGPGCYAVGTSAWTVDCGAHDRCEQHHGSTACSDEFSSASDDYTFAGNCNY